MVRVFADIEELVAAAIEVEKVLGELGETPFEPLKEEREEGTEDNTMEKQVATLNSTLINFFKGNGQTPTAASPSSNVLGVFRSAKQEITRPPTVRGTMKHDRNAPSAICRIGRRTVESSVLTAQVWDTRRIVAGGNPKMEGHKMERQTS
jgi:hypothetical protein